MGQNRIEQSLRLKKLIKELNLNQSEFAKALGMTQPNINRMVNGSSNISVEALNRITNKYRQVNLHWLLTGSGDMFLNESESMEPQVEEAPFGQEKGRWGELEKRIKRLEEIVERLVKNKGK